MGIPDGAAAQPGENLSPQLARTDAPSQTRSFVLLSVDLDAPTTPDEFGHADGKRALQGHVLAEASITGTHAMYARAR